MSRTPFIAGNWKMHKTVAEAEQFIQALLPKVAAVDGVEIVICPPYLALQAMVDSARGSQVGVYAQNMHHERRGRVHRRGVAGDALRDRRRRRRPRPLRAPRVLRRDGRRAAEEGPEGARGRPGADPLRRRDRGGARARGDRAQAAPPGGGGARGGARRSGSRTSSSPTSRSGPSAPGSPRRRSRRRRRARSCARWSRASTRARRSRSASSTAAPASPPTRPSCWRCRTSTARWWAAPRSTRRTSRRSSRPRRA